jgi:hypothetical protein
MGAYRYGVDKESMCFKSVRMCDNADTDGVFDHYGTLDEIQCVPCPDAHHYGQDHHEEDTIVRDVTPTLSKCTWDIWVRDTPVPIRGKNGWTNKGTYTATCFLEEDTKAGCKFPETCEDTMITIQGVIYGIQKAIRLGPETPVGPNGGIVDCTSSTTFRAAGDAANIASVANYAAEKTPGKVVTSNIDLHVGGFTVHADHPLKFKTGVHTYSLFFAVSDPIDSDSPTLEGLPKFADRVHKFDFIGDAKPHY